MRIAFSTTCILILSLTLNIKGQTESTSQTVSTDLGANVSSQITRERREQAYAKLLEGQRYYWQMIRQRSRLNFTNYAKLAKQAFQRAIELDPTLSEAYTALAELAIYSQPVNLEEALAMANTAVKVNPNNFGAHRILAGIYSLKSGINGNKYNSEFAQKAIQEWKEVTRLDPRNAEGWAFLSEFYEKEGRQEEKIEALRKWLSSATPVDTRFYRMVFGGWADISPETAAVRLGRALIKSNRIQEAIEILSPIAADQPENGDLLDALRDAVMMAEPDVAAKAISALEQAAMANPYNYPVVEAFIGVQLFVGRPLDAVNRLKTIIANLQASEKDKKQLTPYYLKLGESYLEAENLNEAIEAYEEALKINNLYNSQATTENDVYLAERIFSYIISAYKVFGRYTEAKVAIERARLVLGASNPFPDKQMISILVETGKKQEALQTIKSLRNRFPNDENLVLQEAQILARNQRLEEGINLIKSLMKQKGKPMVPEDFRYLINVAELYTQADQPRSAIMAVTEFQKIAQTPEQKLIAKILLSNAYYQAGNFAEAEKILSDVLQQSPDNPLVLNNLGYFLVEQNKQVDKAVEMIKKAVRSDPTNPSYLDSLGWAYFKLGNYNEAEKYIRRAIRRGADSTEIYDHMGDILNKQGKYDAARSFWQKALNLAMNERQAEQIREKLRRIR